MQKQRGGGVYDLNYELQALSRSFRPKCWSFKVEAGDSREGVRRRKGGKKTGSQGKVVGGGGEGGSG